MQVKFRTKGVSGSKSPGRFTPESVQDIIRNVFYVGFVARYPTAPLSMVDDLENPKSVQVSVKKKKHPMQIYPGQHEPLYPYEIWEANQHTRASRMKTPGTFTRPRRVSMLKGIARCWECIPWETDDRPIQLRGMTNGSGTRIYVCAAIHGQYKEREPSHNDAALTSIGLSAQLKHDGDSLRSRHKQPNLRAEHVEQQVDQLVMQLKVPPDWHERIAAYYLSNDGLSDYKRKRYNLEQDMERVRTQHRDGLIDNASLKSHILRIGREISNLTPLTSDRAKAIRPFLDDFGIIWGKMTPDEKRLILLEMFDCIYFDSTGQMREVRPRAPFDELLGIGIILPE